MSRPTRAILPIILFLWLLPGYGFSQDDKEKALNKGREAIKLMDEGKMDQAIKLLEESQKLDPARFDYPYEMAFAYYLKEDYKTAINILEKNKDHKDVTERLFQLLGNSYDVLGKSEKAFEAYDEGLKIFPKSGMIYLEKGNVHWGKEEFDKALPYYEKGIQVDPGFPSNYYRACKLYCSSTEEVWGMLYGEIFMNLERNTERTAEISKLLFDTYKREIKFKDDTNITVSFCQQMTMDINSFNKDKKVNLPFCMIYEPTLLIAVSFEKSIDINSLHRIRNNFIDNYYSQQRNKSHPNVLFDYQKQIKDLGHFESYNHWILMKGDEAEFDKWHAKNQDKWNSFIKWFKENALELNENKRFYSSQY